MKKFAIIASVAFLGAIVMPSCKKDYTCVCTSSQQGSQISTSEVSVNNTTKKKAKDYCAAMSTTVTSGGMTMSTECKLK